MKRAYPFTAWTGLLYGVEYWTGLDWTTGVKYFPFWTSLCVYF